VTFTFFIGDCDTGIPFAAGTVAPDGSGVAHPSLSTGPLGAGDYAFQATYNGSSVYNGSTSDCEPFSVEKASPGIATTPNPTSGNVGVTLNDAATLSNWLQPDRVDYVQTVRSRPVDLHWDATLDADRHGYRQWHLQLDPRVRDGTRLERGAGPPLTRVTATTTRRRAAATMSKSRSTSQ
jgi:hypothetical protein